MRAHNMPVAVCILAGVIALASAGQESANGAAEQAGAAFVGERLVYKVEWDPPWFLFFLPKMDAGEAVLHLTGETEYESKKALELRFTANSSGTLVKLANMRIEDEFVFLTEPGRYCTYRVSQKIREGKRKRQIDVQYLRDRRQLHIREIDEAEVPPKVKKDAIKDDIPECVHDPFSALYVFRQSDLQPGYARTLLMGNDDKVREIRAVVEKQEAIQTASGKTPAWRVSIAALMGGLFKEGGQFRIWFSADEKKVPLQFEVRVRIGRVLGTLQDAGVGRKPNPVSLQSRDGNHSSGPGIAPGI